MKRGRNALLHGWVIVALFLQAGEALQWKNFSNEDALCNDFTRAGYYIRNSSSTDWVIFFESGGACYSAETCNRRYLRREVRLEYGGGLITDDFDLPRAYEENRNSKKIISPLMTSISSLNNGTLDEIEGRDLLSTDCETNPYFCNHSHVLVPYCSSDLWLGKDTRYNTHEFNFNPRATNLQFIFRGFVIFQSVFTELFPKNFTGSVMLAGSSAGGVGVINHVKWVKQYLPRAKIRAFIDSSWFINFHNNIYQEFTNFVNISRDSRAADFNITEYIADQNNSLLSLVVHHEPCNSLELGTLCCVSAHCLISNPNYFPADVPILIAFSIYDIYLLAPSLKGINPINIQETSFDVHFDSRGEETEPVGLNLNFLRVIGEYGGVMNSTLSTTSHQVGHLSYFVTSCFQHIYLATSSLWDDGGLFGTDPFEVSNEDNVAILKHTITSGRWNNFKLIKGQDYDISLMEAVGIWLTTANATHRVEFRDTCYTAHCNELCPEEITFGLDDSHLWKDSIEIFIYCIVGIVTLVCFTLKGIFYIWHRWLLRNQRLYLEHSSQASEAGNTISFQFPECTDMISIACLKLQYSVPFSSKKYKETKNYDVNPIILPMFHDEPDGVDQDVADDNSDQGNSEPDAGPSTITGNDDNVFLTAYSQFDSKESEASTNSNGGLLNSAAPLLTAGKSQEEAFPFTEHIGMVLQKMISSEDKKPEKIKNVEKTKTILKGISLYFNPGQLVAIMGPSGSGKTTFLDLLTGRRKYGTINGEIYVNGIKLDDVRDWYVANSGYVLQLAMPYYEELTVRENLTLAAMMRLSNEFTPTEKFKRIQQVMYETGLQSLADTVVGSVVGAGLSGGQKKRLTIALQLIRLPSVLYLDEPTSGLDSASSYELLTYLNRLARSQRTVIMTIHQPRMEIFHMFTRLIMLCEGQVAYHGAPAKAYEVFITALKAHYLEKGLALPELEEQNPADVIMDMLGNTKMREAILQYYQESGDPGAVCKAIKAAGDSDDVTDSNFFNALFGMKKGVFQEQGSVINRVAALEARASLRSSIGQLAYLPVIFFMYGFLLGTVYIQTTSALLIVSGFCVYSVASALFMFPIMHTYYSQALTLYQLEHSDGIGVASDLVIQGFSRFVFLGLIPVAICAGILYLLVINVASYSFTVYLQVLVVNMALNQTWIALLIFVLAGFPSIAFRLSPVISSVAGFTSGFFIPRDSMPPWYRWLFYINPNYYGFSSTSYLLLSNFDSHCAGTELECFITSGEYALNQFNFDETNPAFHIMILLIMTSGYLLFAVFALWVRHTDFKPFLRRLQSRLFRSTMDNTEYNKWTQAHNNDCYRDDDDDDDDDDQHFHDTEMSRFNENGELGLSFDEIDGIDETCFENPHAIELDTSVRSHDTVTSTQSAPCAFSDDIKPLRRSSLATVDELSEDPLPPHHPTENLDKVHNSLEQLLSSEFPAQANGIRPSLKGKASASSSSLPIDGVQKAAQHPEAKQASLATPRPLLHTATSPALKNIPSKISTTTTTSKRKQDSLTRRSTQQEFSSEPVVRRPKKLSIRRRSSRFESKFLNDNEYHEIWKPEKSPRNVATDGVPINKRISTSSMTPASTDNGVEKSKSFNTTSPMSEVSSASSNNDFRLRQQQLFERVNVAREVVKGQNDKLYKPQVSQDDKKLTLKLASRFVSYHISKKPHGLSDVVFHAMDKSKPASADDDRPLSAKEKWQKAKLLVSSASQHTPEMPRPSIISLRSNHSELQLVKIKTLGQDRSKHPQNRGIKLSRSEDDLSKLQKESPPRSRPLLKSRATAAVINVSRSENVNEVDSELQNNKADLLSSPLRVHPKVMATNSRLDNVCEEEDEFEDKTQESVDPPSLPIIFNDLNNNNSNNNSNNVSSLITEDDKPQGHGWSGSMHPYDNHIARLSQLYLPGSSSTVGGSNSSLPEIDHINTHPAITLTKEKSSSTRNLSSELPRVELKQSRSYGSLSRPVSLEKAVRVPVDYQFQQNGELQPTASVSELPPVKVPVVSKLEAESGGPRGSSVNLSSKIVSTSSVLPQMLSPHHPDDTGASSHMSLSHDQTGHVTTSMYAGRQEHRHGNKAPSSANVFQ